MAVLLLAKVKNILCEQGAFVTFNTFWTFVQCLGGDEQFCAILLSVRAHAT